MKAHGTCVTTVASIISLGSLALCATQLLLLTLECTGLAGAAASAHASHAAAAAMPTLCNLLLSLLFPLPCAHHTAAQTIQFASRIPSMAHRALCVLCSKLPSLCGPLQQTFHLHLKWYWCADRVAEISKEAFTFDEVHCLLFHRFSMLAPSLPLCLLSSLKSQASSLHWGSFACIHALSIRSVAIL